MIKTDQMDSLFPKLSTPAGPENIESGYEAINGLGEKAVGTKEIPNYIAKYIEFTGATIETGLPRITKVIGWAYSNDGSLLYRIDNLNIYQHRSSAQLFGKLSVNGGTLTTTLRAFDIGKICAFCEEDQPALGI